jgi:tetratricopeptide (TPR) repeat protein
LQDENWEMAKAEYQKAINLKPEQEHPQNQIAAIDNILAGMAETDAAFQSAIAAADQLFHDESWEQAKAEYQKAVNLKPEQEHPQNQIAAIDNILAGMAETDAAFQSAIAAADQLFQDENWEMAKAEYQKAVNLKPEEEHPQNQIAAIDDKLNAIAEAEAAYDSAIAAGERLFNEQSYEQSKAAFQQALDLQPGERYPAAKIIEIDHLLAELAVKQEQYDSFIAGGDFHYDAGNLREAQASYKAALELFPNITYAQEQLQKVEDELREIRERVIKEYNAIIADADRYFNQRSYDNAINQYMKAAELLPGEDYPVNQIAEITRIIEENVVVDVISSIEVVEANEIARYNFDPVPRQGRRESYIIVKARNMSDRDFRVFLNYGKDGANNGGFVINIPNMTQARDYIVKVGGQYRWFSEDNNWISLQPEGGAVEVSMIQISQE